jgi:hypothetical protein
MLFIKKPLQTKEISHCGKPHEAQIFTELWTHMSSSSPPPSGTGRQKAEKDEVEKVK